VAGTLAAGGVAALAAPSVKVLSTSPTTARLSVTGAHGPFWLVLGESINAGWQARIAGGASLGTSTLIDGYANGWYVVPRSGSFVVDLTWAPQGEVNIALVASAGAIFACLLLAFVPWRRLRRRRAGASSDRFEGTGAEGSSVAAGAEGSSVAAGADGPREEATTGAAAPVADPGPFTGGWPATLGWPWLSDGRPAGLVACILAAVAAGGSSALVLPPPWGLRLGAPIGVATLLCARFGGLRLVLTMTALSAAVTAGAITITGQMAHHYPTGDGWPVNFPAANILAFVAFLALLGDATVELVRERAAARTRDARWKATQLGEGNERDVRSSNTSLSQAYEPEDDGERR
jgi:hypothetical protein